MSATSHGSSTRARARPAERPPPRVRRDRAALACRVGTGRDELEGHHAVRHRVFVVEQGMFPDTDRDDRDAATATVRIIGTVDGRVQGAVRIYPLDDRGLWRGDRLAVLPDSRARRLGAMLVHFAVSTAGELGGRRMVAHIQLPNVAFFESLGWRSEGDPEPFCGRDHQLMAIALSPRRAP